MSGHSIETVSDLLPSEKHFVKVLREVGYGRIELVRVHQGELVLDPLPKIVRTFKFGVATPPLPQPRVSDFVLKRQHIDFFQQIRGITAGEARRIAVQCGLPVSAEFEIDQVTTIRH